MKYRKLALTGLFLLLSFFSIFAQEKQKPEKYQDVFLGNNCCEVGSYIAEFVMQIKAKEDLHGYVVIHGNKARLSQSLVVESWIKGQIINYIRDGEKPPYTVIRGEMEEKGTRVEMWLIPQNSELPFSTKANWDFSLFNINKNVIFQDNTENYGVVCLEIGQNGQFAEILQAKPQLKGHIVIHSASKKEFLENKKYFWELLVDEYQIPPERVKFFNVKKDLQKYRKEEMIYELWLVPLKKR